MCEKYYTLSTGQRMHPYFGIRPVKHRVHLDPAVGFGNPEGILNNIPVKINVDHLAGCQGFPVCK